MFRRREKLVSLRAFFEYITMLGRIQDLTTGGSDKRPPKAVVHRGAWGQAPSENF